VLRYLTAGESHGQALVVIVEGLPAGLAITAEMVTDELPAGASVRPGTRMRFEVDEIRLLAGIRHGRTLGSPSPSRSQHGVAQVGGGMSPAPGAPSKVLTQPRPGHADLAGMQKYGFATPVTSSSARRP